MQNIVNIFINAAEKFPNNLAILYKNEKITYSELEICVAQTSNYFLSCGIKKGDRVLIFVPMSIDLYRIVLALFRIGAVAVFLDEWVNKSRMELCCKIAQCRGFVGTPKAKFISFFSRELRKIEIKLNMSSSIINSHKKINFPVQCNKNDTALITFTTGSSGLPKAADRSHGFLFEQFKALQDTIQPHFTDVDMPVLPIVALMNLGLGCTSVLANFKSSKPNKIKIDLIYRQILNCKVNRITASPYFIKQLANYLIKNNFALYNVKKIFTGGAPVFERDAKLFNKAFPFSNIEIVYGSTEAEPISHISSKNMVSNYNSNFGLSVGSIYYNLNLKIISILNSPIEINSDLAFKSLQLKKGKVGEIVVSGEHVLTKYFNNDNAFKRNKIVVNNVIWHRTGDSGFVDENGNLFLTGPCSNLFTVNGKLVSPFLIENYLLNIEGVEIGTIKNFNDKIVFFIELKSTINHDFVKREILKLGISFDKIIFCKIPRDPRHFSKIEYSKLKLR